MPDTMSPAALSLPVVIGPADGETLSVLGAPMLVKSDAAAAAVFLADHTVPPGYGVPPHIHDGEDEVFYILDGELTLVSAAGEAKARPGDTAVLPRGAMHGFRNDSAAPVRFLVIGADGRQAMAMFRALDKLPAPTPESVGAVCAAHGVRFG
jgi:uncharacterized cupin superfamily protein